ncbi:DUF6178 family protein [Chromobacterium vaccinii]|uniref:DUF6178 family protein n=1 Tax=Chromobacterium vaccinii TaxID=1108595 RepID=UPI003C76C773
MKKTTKLDKRLSTAPLHSGSELIRQIAGSPQLATYIQKLPAYTLNKLIETVGLEDSQEILALVSAEQLKEVLDISLWHGQGLGQREELDIDQFMRWIETLREDEDMLAPRLIALGEDFIVVCLARLISVVDRTVATPEDDGGISIDNYQVFPKIEKHWHVVVEMLLNLSRHAADFLLRALARCDFTPSVGRQNQEEEGEETALLEEDLTGERVDARSASGYVDPVSATLFLMSAKTQPLASLLSQRHYDVNTADFLEKQRQRLALAFRPPSPAPDAGSPPPLLAAASPAPDHPQPSEAESREAFAALDAILRNAGVFPSEQSATRLLTSDAEPQRSPSSSLLTTALSRLRPDIASERMAELAYLSNIMMSGATVQGKTITEMEAAQIVSATGNLGACYLAEQWGEDAAGAGARLQRELEKAPGVVRLFQIGYQLLCSIPVRCAEAIIRSAPQKQALLDEFDYEYEEEIAAPYDIMKLVRENRYGEAKMLTDNLPAEFHGSTIAVLRTLIDATPCFPHVLEAQAGSKNIYVKKGYRHISTMEDIAKIHAFLQGL